MEQVDAKNYGSGLPANLVKQQQQANGNNNSFLDALLGGLAGMGATGGSLADSVKAGAAANECNHSSSIIETMTPNGNYIKQCGRCSKVWNSNIVPISTSKKFKATVPKLKVASVDTGPRKFKNAE